MCDGHHNIQIRWCNLLTNRHSQMMSSTYIRMGHYDLHIVCLYVRTFVVFYMFLQVTSR